MNTKILSGIALVAILVVLILGIAGASAATNAENIIITPPELYEQAKELEHFHDSHGVETEVINTTWIYENYEEAEDPPFDGYKNRSFPGRGYNYSLAKKIIAFLNDSVTHPNLKYVTLFGNARLVPPSYYVSLGTTWDDWIPTDFFYASPDYDFHIEFGVGRLPVNNSEEAEHVVNKIISWYSSLDWNWFKNVAMEGGKDHHTTWNFFEKIIIDKIETYVGEMSVAYIVNHYLSGMNITKFYKTDGNFDREHILQSLSGGYGIVYIATHGGGDKISILRQRFVDVEDILSLPKSTKLPIVISYACSNGAFDTNVYPPQPFPFYTSIGEAILLSDAGGIAYFGSSREAWPDTNFHIDKGYVEMDELLYMPGMLSKIFKAYHEGETFLGDIVKKAMEEFYSDADFSNRYDKATFFEFVFLGDPALELPALQPGTSYQQPKIIALNPDGYKEIFSVSEDVGKLGDAPYFEIGKPITLQITTDSPTISIKRMEDIMSYEPNIVERIENISINGTFNYTFIAYNATDYLIRVSAADGKEGWFYLLAIEPEENDTTPPEIIDHSPIGNNVPIDTRISVTFSEAMNKTSVQNAFSISPYVSGSFSWDKNTMFFIPDFNLSYNTTYTMTIGTEAEDLAGNNLEAVYSWNFTTAPPNNPPTLSPIGNKTVNEGNLLEFTVSASDPDGDNLTYSVSNLPEGASFINQTFRWTPSYDQAGIYEVTFSVEDGRGGKDTETIFIIVKDVNRAPILAPIGNKTIDEGNLLEFNISASDPDGDTLTYSATNLPRGASFVGQTFRWTPDYDQAGTYEATFIVEDGKGGKDSETIYITVNDVQPEQAEQPELPLGSKDLDGDGLYEDINGDGKLDFDDIVYFQWHYYEDDFQNYKQYYDFDKDGDVDIGDVLELYVFWKWGFWL